MTLMRKSYVLPIILLGIGVALLVWGGAASDSLSSEASNLFHGAPGGKALLLMLLGLIACGFGVAQLDRRPA
jgi:drug/metabolite transporter (DMT)-like permease